MFYAAWHGAARHGGIELARKWQIYRRIGDMLNENRGGLNEENSGIAARHQPNARMAAIHRHARRRRISEGARRSRRRSSARRVKSGDHGMRRRGGENGASRQLGIRKYGIAAARRQRGSAYRRHRRRRGGKNKMAARQAAANGAAALGSGGMARIGAVAQAIAAHIIALNIGVAAWRRRS